MKLGQIFALIGFLVVVGGGVTLYLWAFHSANTAAPLTADGILVFDSPKAIGRTYTAALPAFPDELHPHDGLPNRPDGFDHFLRIRFAAERPVSSVRAATLAELNRVRAQKGKRTWNNAALNKAQLYTIGADIEMTAGKCNHARPDVTLFQREDDSLLSLLKTALQNGGVALAVDPGDPHVLTITVRAATGATPADDWPTSSASFTMKFAQDWKQADISIPDMPDGPAAAVATTQDNFPEGPYVIKLATTGLVNVTVTPDYLFSRLSDKGLINPTIPVYFHTDGGFAGKVYVASQNKTYRFHAARRDGALKLFLDDDAVLSLDPQRPTPSLIRYTDASGSRFFISYTATLEKADLHGKEQEIATNFPFLGSVPETAIGAPNVWGTYFDLSQRHYGAKDIAADPALRQVFGLGHGLASSAGGSIALEIAAKHQDRPAEPKAHRSPSSAAHVSTATAEVAPDPNRSKTDAEIEREMQEKLHKRRY